MNKMSFRFLGTGASMGVPVVSCHCEVCLSKNPKNKRMRSSGLLNIDHKTYLIDSGPDYRQQALQFGAYNIDGLIITHMHYDHVGGINDLRPLKVLKKKQIPCLLSRNSYQELYLRSPYLFDQDHQKGISSLFCFQVVEEPITEVVFEGFKWNILSYEQNGMSVMGLRIGNFAYLTDMKIYSEEIFSLLKGVEVLVLSALQYTSSPSHLGLDEVLQFAQKVQPRQTWLSHIGHNIDYDEAKKKLPLTVKLAYDGLMINVN